MHRTDLIKRKIVIPPHALGADLSSYVATTVEQMERKLCTRQHGYILRIIGDVVLSVPVVSNANSEVGIQVAFRAETLLPKTNEPLTGRVWKTFPEGVFLEVEELLKVLVPASTIPGYRHDDVSPMCEAGPILPNSQITALISGVRYKCGSFSVVASFSSLIPPSKDSTALSKNQCQKSLESFQNSKDS